MQTLVQQFLQTELWAALLDNTDSITMLASCHAPQEEVSIGKKETTFAKIGQAVCLMVLDLCFSSSSVGLLCCKWFPLAWCYPTSRYYFSFPQTACVLG